MRVFIALGLPNSALDMLELLQQRLIALNAGGRLVPRVNMHLTFRFFEDLTDAQLDLAAEAAEAVARTLPTPLMTLLGLGGFVRSGGDTVYARLGGDTAAVLAMEQALAQALQERKIKPDLRPFYPHITLIHGANYRIASQLQVKSDFFFATDLTLFRSILAPGAAPVYDPLLTLPLQR